MSPRGMAVSNTRYLSSSVTMVYGGMRGWKLHLSEWTWCQESVGGICYTNKWREASLQPLTFSNHCSNARFSNASPVLTVRFWGVIISLFWKRESITIEWRQCRLTTRQLLFCLHIYSLCTNGFWLWMWRSPIFLGRQICSSFEPPRSSFQLSCSLLVVELKAWKHQWCCRP